MRRFVHCRIYICGGSPSNSRDNSFLGRSATGSRAESIVQPFSEKQMDQGCGIFVSYDIQIRFTSIPTTIQHYDKKPLAPDSQIPLYLRSFRSTQFNRTAIVFCTALHLSILLGINIVKGRNRNHPCPCGSGHKYKKCCGAFSAIQNPDPTIPYREIPPEVQQAFIQHQVREAERIRKFGHVGPIIAADHQGYKFVAVGNRLHYSKSWKTFHDFLWEYIAAVVTKEWGDAELKKPFAERHPIAQWYHHLCDFQRMAAREEPGGIYSAIATGSVMAYTALAYDLYTLAHHT